MKAKTIEELLSWAFVEELPKGGGVEGLENVNSAWRMLEASSWGKIAQVALLGQRIDEGSGSGNYFIEQGEPHPDALAIGAAVAALGHGDVLVPAGWNPIADWSGEEASAILGAEASAILGAQAVARAVALFMGRAPLRRGAHIVSLLAGTAVLGRDPDWSAEEPKLRMVERGGRPAWFEKKAISDGLGGSHMIEVDGYNPRTGRPVKGAYRKWEFSADPVGDILSRLDWQIWVAACRHVGREVAPRLGSHRLLPSDRSMTPWLGEDRGGVIILGGGSQAKKAAGAR